MRDLMATKMAELKFEAPLARFEEAEDWVAGTTGDRNTASSDAQTTTTTTTQDDNNCFLLQQHANNNNNNVLAEQNATAAAVASLLAAATATDVGDGVVSSGSVCDGPASQGAVGAAASEEPASFGDAFSGSLEDLVHTFDEKLTRCFCDYEQSVEALAPVQVRSQDDIMSECQMWWTITGNFGNILPIDWSKSCSRKMQLGSLHLSDPKECGGVSSPGDELLSSEDEAAAADLDMHALILSGLGGGGGGGALEAEVEEEPIKTAEEVIREIDDLLQESPPPPRDDDERRPTPALASPLYEDKLRGLSASRLNELYLELELLIRDFSETLIAELALRDELEYEKELKNTFISLLLAVQNRRRQHHVERKRRAGAGSQSSHHHHHHGLLDPKYLTTVIPYHLGSGPPDNQALQVLIKILKAINEDSPTVPTLLTDYILKVLCPT